MGNYVSCTIGGGKAGGHGRTAKVILPGGQVRRIEAEANAAELMLDVPGHFLVNSRSMHVGRRFGPLAADEELEMGQVYVMFPMKRVNAVVTADDMGALLLAAREEVRREMGGGARVLPDALQGPASRERAAEDEEHSQPEESEDVAAAREAMERFKYRLSMCRSRRPNLETIVEEGICSKISIQSSKLKSSVF